MLKSGEAFPEAANEICNNCDYCSRARDRDRNARVPRVPFVFLLICLLVLPFCLLGLIRGLDRWLPLDAFTRLPDGEGTWLSFWGSYLGCVATIILSAAALHLSKEINKYAWYKNTADEVESFHQFRVKKISLYKVPVDYPEEIDYFPQYDNEEFLLAVSFESFPPYYDIGLQPLEIFSCDANKTKLELDSVQRRFINAGEYSHLYYLFNAGKDLREFMLLHVQGANTKTFTQRQRCIHLSMLCKNTLYGEDPGYYRPFFVDLRIWAVNAKAARPAPDASKNLTECPLPLEVVRQTVTVRRASRKLPLSHSGEHDIRPLGRSCGGEYE